MMRIDILTLFPNTCNAVLNESILGRAAQNGAIKLCCHNIRDYAYDKHHRVDDTPYGGGHGMVLMAEPIALCFEDLCQKLGCKPHFVCMSPQGEVFNQQKACGLSQMSNLAILCGHYEGIDERVLDELIDEQVSMGDFVVTGGELPALILVDAVARLVSGVLSDSVCYEDESHYSGLLEYPQYTKPQIWRGREVPEVLLSGHHANINKWRYEQSLSRTKALRPDLIQHKMEQDV